MVCIVDGTHGPFLYTKNHGAHWRARISTSITCMPLCKTAEGCVYHSINSPIVMMQRKLKARLVMSASMNRVVYSVSAKLADNLPALSYKQITFNSQLVMAQWKKWVDRRERCNKAERHGKLRIAPAAS
jgi:hypothetical protein